MIKKFLIIPALMLAPFSAHAIVWNTKLSSDCLSGCNTLTSGNSQTFSGSGTGAPNVTVSAFSTKPELINSNQTFETATLALYNGNGLGATAQIGDGSLSQAPNHAFDNNGSPYVLGSDLPDGGAVDAALFHFDQSVSLTSISLGWSQYDSDISILAYNPTNLDPATPNIIGNTFSGLIAAGWQLVGNYADIASTSQTIQTGSTVINTSISSSYWLVSAFTNCSNATKTNSNCVAGTSANGGSLDFGNDYFKISGLGGKLSTSGGGGNTGSVPEPSSLLLFVGGLLGWRLNRHNKAQSESDDCLTA